MPTRNLMYIQRFIHYFPSFKANFYLYSSKKNLIKYEKTLKNATSIETTTRKY